MNIEATSALAQAIGIPVIASGGVASIRDIEQLKPFESDGIQAVIIGRAMYTGAVKLTEAIRVGKGL